MGGLTLNTGVSAAAVFLQGLLSFFSPCVLPLLPVYFGYLSGGAATRTDGGELRYDRKKVALNTVFFVVGIAFAFLLLGLGMTALGTFFGPRRTLFARIGGVVVILFGLYQLGVFGKWMALEQERRLPFRLDRAAASPWTALVMGFLFSFAWTPCVGPALSGVLLMAASAASRTRGLLLLGLYTLGFVLPFLAAGFFTATLLQLFRKHRNVVRYTAKIGGAVLILMGVLMLSGTVNRLSGRLAAVPAVEQTQQTPSEPEKQPEEETNNSEKKRRRSEKGRRKGR
jgi:cytochrome c-type biogenesis protein